MTLQQKELILATWIACDEDNISPEYMLQRIADVSKVSYAQVVEYIASDESFIDRENFKTK